MLPLSVLVYNLDIKPGLISKALSILQIFYLAYASFSACILFVAFSPYVSMGIVAYFGSTTSNLTMSEQIGFQS